MGEESWNCMACRFRWHGGEVCGIYQMPLAQWKLWIMETDWLASGKGMQNFSDFSSVSNIQNALLLIFSGCQIAKDFYCSFFFL